MSDSRPDTSSQSARGSIGPETYAQVRRLIDRGMNKTEAFAQVARETGRSAYYRIAKRQPGGGGVRQSARTTTHAAKKVGGAQAERLAHDARAAIDALHKHVAALEAQLEELTAKSRELDRLKKAIGKI